jgi:hypothetical protein
MSPRIKQICQGFKQSTCFNKRCLSCAPDPPTLSIKLIKKIGTDFSKVDQNLLSDETLQVKRQKPGTVGRKKEGDNKTRILGDKKPEKIATCSKSQERMTAQMFKSFS